MQTVATDSFKWVVPIGKSGLFLEIVCIYGQSAALWRWRDQIFANASIGEC